MMPVNTYNLFGNAMSIAKSGIEQAKEDLNNKKGYYLECIARTVLATVLAYVLAKLLPAGEARIASYALTWLTLQAIMYKISKYKARYVRYQYCSNVVLSKLKNGEYTANVK